MKNLLLLIFFLTFSLSISSQSLTRENEMSFHVSGVIESIDHAVGWNKNLSGKWIDFNRLDYNQELNIILNENDKPGDHGYYSSYNSNFYSISKHEVNYAGHEPMIMIVIDFLDGYFKYPHIRQDWESVRSFSVFLFTRQEINDFNKKYNKKINRKGNYKLNAIRSDLFEESKGFTFTEMLSKAKYSYPFKITLQPINEENQRLVRFDLRKYYHANQPSFGSHKFENHYFEIEWEQFEKVFSDL
jgi:hypothetical protein